MKSIYLLIQTGIALMLTCTSAHSAGTCQNVGTRCMEGKETRIINGYPITKDCWKYEDTYSCIDTPDPNKNFCKPLEDAGSTCSQTHAVCSIKAPTGECLTFTNEYQCTTALNPLSSNIQVLPTTFKTVTDKINTKACDGLNNSTVCQKISETCVEGEETRNINGLDIHKTCWKWEQTHQCVGTNLNTNCQDLTSNPKCTETGSMCEHTLPDGRCSEIRREFKCVVKEGVETKVTDCNGQTFCSDSKCFDTSSSPDTDFSTAATGLETALQAGNSLNATHTLFNGTYSSCKANGGINPINCCVVSPKSDLSNKAMGEIGGSNYLYDKLFNNSALLALGPALNTFLDKIIKCDDSDKVLSLKRGNGLCTTQIKKCDKNAFGCYQYHQAYCCYNSKIAKIIATSGRIQLGIDRSQIANNTDCSGLTAEQIEQIDFSKIDFSEFINEIQAGMINSGITAESIKNKIKD